MPRLKKPDLLQRFEEAVRVSGWNLLYLSQDVHPARYRIYRNGSAVNVQVYIWNISHGGGKKRSPTEYRIQITGVTQFGLQPNARTLILGWWDEAGVFAGWDLRQHSGLLGSSPSMQIDESALRKATYAGFAPYTKSNSETALAFRPDFMGVYIEHLEALHDSGKIPSEADLLQRLGDDPEAIQDSDIEDEIAPPRRTAIRQTRRALRANDFSRRVLTAYGHRCAVCGVQLRLLDGAHILPVTHEKSTDQTSNGVALCALHHRAYDGSLITFDSALRLHINKRQLKSLETGGEGGGAKAFLAAVRSTLHVPSNAHDRPKAKFVLAANALRGWTF